MSMRRPTDCERIHFSLDGTIALTRRIPPDFTRTGDTASGTDEEDETLLLWRCEVRGRQVQWVEVEEWTEELAKQYVEAATMLCVVTDEQLKVIHG